MKMKNFMFVALISTLSLFGCNTPDVQDPSPREIAGLFKYTGATYSPIHFNAPYRYAVHDLNRGFIAYVDTTKIVMNSTNAFVNKPVIVRGAIVKEDGNSVMRAESVRLQR